MPGVCGISRNAASSISCIVSSHFVGHAKKVICFRQCPNLLLFSVFETARCIRRRPKYGHLEERGFGASIEANFIVGSQVRLHRVTNACPQAYFGMILARISGGFRILNRIRLWAVVAHGKRGGGSCSLAWPW